MKSYTVPMFFFRVNLSSPDSSMEKSLIVQKRPERASQEDEEDRTVKMHCCQWL
jgi:hypothetical protein